MEEKLTREERKLERDIKRLDDVLHELRTLRLSMSDRATKEDLNIVIKELVDIRLTLAKKLSEIAYAAIADIIADI